MFATAALFGAGPLYMASAVSADGATAPVGTLASKDPAHPAGTAQDDGPSGDDKDGTTLPGQTTSTDGGNGGTSTAGTSAEGETTAAGETSEGGPDTTHQPAPPPPPEQPPLPPPDQPPAVTPPQPPPPPVVLTEGPVAPPTARLRAESGCPPQAFFARVTGRQIARVSFTLDGKRYATVTRADGSGVWKVRIDPRKLGTGKHRLVATASFTSAGTAALRQAGSPTRKVLTVTFTVCARKASRPAFTG